MQVFRIRPQNTSKYPPGEHNFFGEIRVFLDDVAIGLLMAPAREREYVCDMGGFCATGSQLQVDENTSSVGFGCLRLLSGEPDALTHPIGSVTQFRGR